MKQFKAIQFITKRFSRSNSKISTGSGGGGGEDAGSGREVGEVEWEVRPGGMLVQKRVNGGSSKGDGLIRLRVSMGSELYDISVEATSSFGEVKMILSSITDLKPGEQRLLFKGKEREDEEYLHMVGVGDMDKLFLLEDPASTEKKQKAISRNPAVTL